MTASQIALRQMVPRRRADPVSRLKAGRKSAQPSGGEDDGAAVSGSHHKCPRQVSPDTNGSAIDPDDE